MKTWAYVFISTRQPKRVLSVIRTLSGVIHADALFGTLEIIAIVGGEDIPSMDAVIDEIADIPDVENTDSHVARVIDGIGPPRSGEKLIHE